jgi:hypothetical protein
MVNAELIIIKWFITILAGVVVTKIKILTSQLDAMFDREVFLGNSNTWNLHGHTWAMDVPALIVMNHVDSVQKDKLDSSLPIDHTQWKNAQWTKIFIQQ